jgi:hypothetical protein
VTVNSGLLVALSAVPLPWIIEWHFRRRKSRIELPTLRFLLNSEAQ